MLNNFVRAKALESSSSVDLLEIDLLNGNACLVKSGAAPSFIKRGTNVFRLHSRTAPIGIMKELDGEKLDFSKREGDIVVMISDGIASDERDSKFLVDLLSSVEIVENDEIIDTSPSNEIKKEVLSPINTTEKITLDAPSKDLTPKRLTLDALPDAIIALAKQRGAPRDDMSVSVIKIMNAEF
jgi:serine phosphatase RsbU (regulator of sigma subunit)